MIGVANLRLHAKHYNLQVRLAGLVMMDVLVALDFPVLPEPLDSQDPVDALVMMDVLVALESLEQLDHLASEDLLEQLDHLDSTANLVPLVSLEALEAQEGTAVLVSTVYILVTAVVVCILVC